MIKIYTGQKRFQLPNNPSRHYFVQFQNLVYMHVFPSGFIQKILFSFPSVLSKTENKVFLFPGFFFLGLHVMKHPCEK